MTGSPSTKRVNLQVMNRFQNRGLWLLLGVLALLSLTLFFIPAFIIRPFRHQSQRALDIAIAVKRIAPVLTVTLLVGVLRWVCVCGGDRPDCCGRASQWRSC